MVLDWVPEADCLHGLSLATATRREGGIAVWLRGFVMEGGP